MIKTLDFEMTVFIYFYKEGFFAFISPVTTMKLSTNNVVLHDPYLYSIVVCSNLFNVSKLLMSCAHLNHI